MKKKIIIILGIFLLFSCKKEEKNFVRFSGKIIGKNTEKIQIQQNGKKIKTFSIDKNGVFSDTINNVKRGYYSFNDGKESSEMYLENGYDMYLTLDTKKFDETIKYTGNGSEVNNYLVSKFLINEKVSMKNLFTLKEKEFITSINTKYDKLSSSIVNLKNTNFIASEKKNLLFEKANQLNMYQGYHGYLLKDREFKTSDSFPNAFEGISFDNDEDYKNFPAYHQIIITNFFKSVREKSKKDSISFLKVAINFIKEVKGKNIKNGLLKTLANEVSKRNKDAESLYNIIMATSTDQKFKENLTKKFERIQKLVKGKLSPKFVNYENFKGGTTSLDDLKGKFVYIDVWATWCRPCKEEMPFLKKLEKRNYGKNIQFVSISIDKKKDHKAWLKMVEDEKLGGVQLFANKNWNSDFVKEYAINGIPRFILIDPVGNIVSADAQRPSSPLIDKFLKENGVK